MAGRAAKELVIASDSEAVGQAGTCEECYACIPLVTYHCLILDFVACWDFFLSFLFLICNS